MNIPDNLEACFQELDKLISPEDRFKIREGQESEMCGLHFGFGMSLRNEWGLWRGSVLSQWFNSIGIHHPDDMSGIILTSYWRYLNKLPIQLDEQVKYYQDYWEKQGIDLTKGMV